MDINLTDRDIQDICQSKGLIGVCMHDGRMPGGIFKKAIKEAQGRFDNVRIARVNRLYAQIFLMNVFHIVRVSKAHIEARNKTLGENTDPATAWDTICLGTDYDGIIDPFNHLTTAESLEDFKEICINSLEFRDSNIAERKHSKIRLINHKNTKPYNKKIIDELMMGMTPRELMTKVFSLNALEFLKKYFNEDYLINRT
jgi:microsomal dipeptidase-like Zn-dependent dipeptidase